MTTESLEHIFIFVGIISTWLFPLWLYFHWLRNYKKYFIDYITAIAYSGAYFTLISHNFKFTVSVTV